MHNILEIAFGVALGMVIFLVIVWILGMCVYVCCGDTKRIATIKKVKTYPETKESDVKSEQEPPKTE